MHRCNGEPVQCKARSTCPYANSQNCSQQESIASEGRKVEAEEVYDSVAARPAPGTLPPGKLWAWHAPPALAPAWLAFGRLQNGRAWRQALDSGR